MNRIIFRTIGHLLPLLALIWTSAYAGDLSIPHTFTAGSAAKASEVNANFNAVATAVDDNHARITQLENDAGDNSDITALQNQVTSLQSALSDLQDQIADLQSGLALVTSLQSVMTIGTDAQGHPAVIFSNVNVHINDGTGDTNGTPNGRGNLIIGYDEARSSGSDKSGSHNVVIGRRHNYTRSSGLVVGNQNTVSGDFASVTGGFGNTASGPNSSVSGGVNNTASGTNSSVSGGLLNTASGAQSSVSGGQSNTASGENSSVSGGLLHEAFDIDDWSGGDGYYADF